MNFAVTLSSALVAYNAALNVRPTGHAAYVPLNVSVAAACVAAARRQGVGWTEMGLEASDMRRGAAAGAGLAAVAGVLLAAALVHPRTRDVLADERAADVTPADLAYRALVRIPIGTALAEEVLFRGVVEGAFAKRLSPGRASVAANVAFGLWHLGPGVQALRMNRIRGRGFWVGLAGMIVGTGAGGVFLSHVRNRTGSLLAPVVLHALVNSMSVTASAAAHAIVRRGEWAETIRGPTA